MAKIAKKATSKQKKQNNDSEKSSNFFDYFRFGESYTSLILGIIVVIIATALLLSFVHNKNAGNVNAPISEQTQNTVQVSQQASDLARKAPSNTVDNVVTVTPTSSHTIVPIMTVKPTQRPAPTVTVKPTQQPAPTNLLKPTQPVKPTQPAAPTVKPQPTHAPKVIAMAQSTKRMHIIRKKHGVIINKGVGNNRHNKVWIVQKGESLWLIAEQAYGSGYNWTDIAKANNLVIPSDIHVGDRLLLPSVAPKQSTIAAANPTSAPSVTTNDEQYSSTKQTNTEAASGTITGTTYTVEHGDNLWNIAVRAYGDGYRYVDIEKANNLTNPGMIFSGNVLTIPR